MVGNHQASSSDESTYEAYSKKTKRKKKRFDDFDGDSVRFSTRNRSAIVYDDKASVEDLGFLDEDEEAAQRAAAKKKQTARSEYDPGN